MVKIQECSGENSLEAGVSVLNRGVGTECWIQILGYFTKALKKARISWLTVLSHHGVSPDLASCAFTVVSSCVNALQARLTRRHGVGLEVAQAKNGSGNNTC
jgi:hypothetical protein